MKLKIGRDINPDMPEVRIYHSGKVALTETVCTAERGVGIFTTTGEPTDNPFAEALLNIDGVVATTVKPYSIILMKARGFDWKDIEPALLRLISAFNIDLERAGREWVASETLELYHDAVGE